MRGGAGTPTGREARTGNDQVQLKMRLLVYGLPTAAQNAAKY